MRITTISKVEYKKIIGNFFLTLSSIYIPLVLISAFDFYSINNPQRIAPSRRKIEDLPQKIAAVEEGRFPIFAPDVILHSKAKPPIYPIGSLPYTKSYYCNEGYGLIKYKTDRFGLRNFDDKWSRIKKQRNIFLIGDSFVHGACVNDNETISRKLESFSNINTLNLGSGSNGPYEYMAIMKSLIKPILKKSNKENTVILVFYDNDNKTTNKKKESLVNITNSIVEFSPKLGFYPKDSYLKKYYNFIRSNYDLSKSEIISEIKKVAKKNFKNSAFYNISTIFPLRKRMKLINSFFIRENYNETFHSPSQRAILMLSNICKNKCKPYIAYIPERNIGNFNSRKVLKYKKTLVETSNKLKIPFLDAQKFLDKRNRDNYAPKGSHLSIKGYEDFANFLNKNIN